jgi:hypothetical protein
MKEVRKITRMCPADNVKVMVAWLREGIFDVWEVAPACWVMTEPDPHAPEMLRDESLQLWVWEQEYQEAVPLEEAEDMNTLLSVFPRNYVVTQQDQDRMRNRLESKMKAQEAARKIKYQEA